MTTTQPTAQLADIPDEQLLVSVVIPVYNERGNIKPLAEEIEDVCDTVDWDYEVIWVNDGSTDDSRKRINTVAAICERQTAIHLRRNRGQSAAMAAGFDYADGSVIVPMDGDGQNDPADIPVLVDDLLAKNLDCVSGVRAERNDPLAKRIPSNIQTQLTRAMVPEAGTDMGCTLKAYRADALDNIDLRGEHHRYIPAKLAQRGYALSERDVNHREREHGESHYGAGRLLRGFLDGLYHLMMTRYGTRPIHLFGTIGLAMLTLGGLLGGHMLIERLVFFNPISQHLPRLILIAVLVLGGLLVFALGILSEVLTRVLYADEQPYRIREVIE